MYFYYQSLTTLFGEVQLEGTIVQHIRALRLRGGDTLILFDGSGHIRHAKLLDVGKKSAVVSVISPVEKVKKAKEIDLVIGMPKLATLEFILTKVTELGVSKITLVKGEYTPVAFDQKRFEQKIDRWQKLLIAACEQSQRPYLPQLYYEAIEDFSITTPLYVCHPGAKQGILSLNLKGPATFAIGPEGGWSSRDLSCLNADLISLSDAVLRTDTACMAALIAAHLN
ncbi:16S rRNA (uracil(1498)-N(3))-methyltransferase [Gammaproteobacteria bacterium]|nr:16S rRNA (uracil(1498)-N(3))-methyltransferase [Gammaproteobacteria bacterium]